MRTHAGGADRDVPADRYKRTGLDRGRGMFRQNSEGDHGVERSASLGAGLRQRIGIEMRIRGDRQRGRARQSGILRQRGFTRGLHRIDDDRRARADLRTARTVFRRDRRSRDIGLVVGGEGDTTGARTGRDNVDDGAGIDVCNALAGEHIDGDRAGDADIGAARTRLRISDNLVDPPQRRGGRA